MGSVAAGSLFAFFQSAAMGGAAMGLFAGLGALGGVMAVTAGVAASKETVDGVVGNIRGFVETEVVGKVAPVVENVKSFVEKEIVGGFVEKFKGFFWK